MKFRSAPLVGAYVVELDKFEDGRGFFARAFCAREFGAAGLETNFVQANSAFTKKKGTFRGFHFQLPPAAEVKLVRCVRGAIYDMIIDVRAKSPTYKQSFGAELSEDNRSAMYIPHGFAHGLMTLTDDVEVHYLVSAYFESKQERGIRMNDPAFNVALPMTCAQISDKDSSWPDLDEAWHGVHLFEA
jgi:dTDP-4-dehydrorhamnose 3,5-epimerase